MNTPRKHLWPKRWLRSFAGAALATTLASGAVWGQPVTPPAKPMDAVKAEPAKADPKVPAPAPKPKQITFAMSDKPWSAVIEWYANETQLAFNSVEKPPTGTFNFIPPKDPKTGQPKQYTLSEVTNVINESLLTKNYVLVRGETTFRLWPASEKLDPALVRRVDVGELKTLASKDAVQVVLPLQHLNAADQVLDVQKMMSKIGEVVPLQGRNGLIMIDYAGNLQRIVDDLTSTEAGDTAADTYSYTCQFIKARDAAAQVREFLGVAQPDTGGGGDSGRRDRGSDRFSGFGDRGSGGFDPRQFMPGGGGFDPRAFDPGRGGGDQGRRGFGARGAKPTYIIHDDATNSVHINAPADQVARAKAFLTKIDVGKEKVIPGRPE